MKTRNVCVLLIVTMVLTLITSACGGTAAPADTSPKEEATVAPASAATEAAATEAAAGSKTLRITIDSWLIKKWPIDDAAAKFMKDNPDTTVTVAPNADDYGNNWLLPWSQGQTDSDLMCGAMDTTLSPFVAKDVIIPLDEMLTDDGKVNLAADQFVPSLLEACKYGSHYYCLPFMGEVYYPTVNTAMMKEAGLVDDSGKPVPPKSLDEWYDYAQKLTKKDAAGQTTTTGLYLNWAYNSATITYLAMLQAEKGTYWDDDHKGIDFSSDAARKVLTFARNIVADGWSNADTVTDENADRNAMKAGTAGMILTFHSRFKEAQTSLGGTDKATVMAWPGVDQNGSNAQAIVCVIPKASPAIDLAKQFMREQMMDKANQQWSANEFGKLPSLTRNFDGLADPEYGVVLQALAKAGFGPKFVQFNELDKLVQTETQKYILGQQDLDTTLTNLQTGSAKLDLSLVSR